MITLTTERRCCNVEESEPFYGNESFALLPLGIEENSHESILEQMVAELLQESRQQMEGFNCVTCGEGQVHKRRVVNVTASN